MRTAVLAPFLLIQLVVALSAAGQEAVTVKFEARGGGNSTLPARLELRLTAASDPAISRSATLIDGRGEVSVPAGTEWDLRSGSAAFAIAKTRITGSPDAVVPFDVWPAASLKARVVAPADAKIDEVSVDVTTLVGQDSVVPRGTKFPCDRGPEGELTCAVPVAARHFVVRVPEMVPHYLWDLGLTAGQTQRLGTIALRRGASLTAYLERRLAQQLQTPARARLMRPVPAVPSETTARLSVPVAEGTFDKRGFVQLGAIPAGQYVLQVDAKGFAPANIGPLEIYEGKESAFRKAIELFPPVQVRVTVEPARDAEDRPWKLRWEQVGDFAPAGGGVTLQTDAQGRAVIADQPPGLFSLEVLDLDGNPLWQEDVRVDDRDLTVPVTLDLQIVNGTVTVGETPLPATLWFGTEHGAVRARATSDAEGRFEVRLPHLAEWPVEIVNRELAIHSIVKVDIDDERKLAIELPDTSVSGWVVDADGQRLSRGTVTARVSGRAVTTGLTPAGEFRLRGVPEGSLHLLATNTQDESSAPVALQVIRDVPLRDVELRILQTRRFAGTVVSSGQPVVGAHVSVFPLEPRGGNVVEAVTDVAGKFDVVVADRAVRLLVVIGAPNRTLQTFDVPASAEATRYEVAPRGGTVELQFDSSPDSSFRLTRDGVEIPLTSLFSWIFAHGARIHDPNRLRVMDLAPGHYQACRGSAKCADGVLAAGATLELRVPD